MATQVQNRRGTTAEHSTFTGAVGEVTIDTDKDTVVVHDGATAGGRPLLREDQSNLPTSAPTTGIYNSSGALALSTNGTGRLFVDSSGRVGVGKAAPGTTLHLRAGNPVLTFEDGVTGDISSISGDSGVLVHATGGSERLRITSTGLVGIGTSSPGAKLEVQGGSAASDVAVHIKAGDGGSTVGLIVDGDSETGDVLIKARSNSAATPSDSDTKFIVTGSGNVGIGTTSPGYLLDLFGTTPALRIKANGVANGVKLEQSSATGDVELNVIDTYPLIFKNANTERCRLDTSGRLLVGTSSSSSNATIVLQGNSGGSTGGAVALLQCGTSAASIGATATDIGYIWFADNAGGRFAEIKAQSDATAGNNDYPGRLVFSTTADGASSPTERMRISSSGVFDHYTTETFNVRSTRTAAATPIFNVFNGASSTSTGSLQLVVRADGDVENTNNSYGAISDIKLKENIVDASSQWSDIKELQIRKYNFKPETGYGTHTQIGLVAQEVELVSPGLVSESPDRDEDGNDLGTVTKSVNYSVLYMKAVKALQEAMERIETLEAKVAALETA